MSTINQKEYLKKYLSLGSEPGKKKKRKKKSTNTSDRVKIIDDDIDAVVFNQAVEDDLNAQNEDAPQIVGVIDDRPLELRISDYRDSDLWKPLSGEHNEARTIQNRDAKPTERRSSSYSPPRKRDKHSRSSDESLSPIRDYKRANSPNRKSNRSITPSRSRFDKRGDDVSPVRRNRNHDDISPKRRNRRDNDISPARRNRSPFRGNKRDNDASPARRGRRDSEISPNRKGRRDGDISPSRKSRARRDSDPSPPRRSRRDGGTSPPRRNPTQIKRNRRDSDDVSPPRRNVSPSRRGRRDSDTNLTRWDRRNDTTPAGLNKYKAKYNISPTNSRDKRERSGSRRNKRDSDATPPRRYRSNSDSRERRHISPKRRSREISPKRRSREISPKRRSREISPKSPDRTYNNRNMSPPRRNRKESPNRSSTSRYISPNRGGTRIAPRDGGDSDSNRSRSFEKDKRDYNKSKTDRDKKHSPNRGNEEKIVQEPAVVKSRSSTRSRWDQEPPTPKQFSPPPLPPKPRDNRKSGLQRANDIIMGKDPSFQPSIEFSDIAGFSGGVAPIVRDRKTGKIRDFQKEEEEAAQKKEKEDELKAKYARWGRGLKQVEDATDKLNSELHEMSKPLARYADDEDLEKHLKEMERDGDPMLQYLRKKRKKQEVESGKPVKPQFEGEFMPNRYGIGPGHRWDGVDRSNGYEKKWFEVMNSRRAQLEDAYKWSTEDM
ncbi:bud13 [Holotrichia oblita]|uniref:Bud13 n=1 Tax=Holotrichia oblita TaxID=644536 RepID=A0ACB9TZP4_HOLOL|nr:bud13 [Holotrichia oblita]